MCFILLFGILLESPSVDSLRAGDEVGRSFSMCTRKTASASSRLTSKSSRVGGC